MDEKTFIDTFERYYECIYRFVYFRLNQNKHAAEDAAQEIFLKVWKKRADYSANKSSIRTWLYIIARSYIIDIYKKPQAASSADESILEQVADQKENTEEESLMYFLTKTIKLLDEESRELITLRYIEGIEIEEISVIIGKSYDATKVAIFRAFNKLKEKINGSK